MRWFVYFIVAYVMLGLQAGVAPFVRLGGAPVNLVLLTALFIALNAPRSTSRRPSARPSAPLRSPNNLLRRLDVRVLRAQR